ncbi:MAG: ATPase with chaperone activity, partial [Rhodoferax sp.]|nr:ATPase with chaperone activity [Rhodoferax sp.]
MSEGNQLFIPATFLALYMAPGAHKPSAAQAHIAAHYELCEDLAQMLTGTATELQ